MAITKSWTDAWLDGKSDTGDKIDNKMNEMSSAIHERMKNGGHRWEDGNESQSGIHYVSVDNYRPDEWNVFKSDLTSQVITCKDDEFRVSVAAYCESTLHVDGNVNLSADLDVSGKITQNGSNVLDESSPKRQVVFTVYGQGSSGSGGDQLFKHRVVVPYDCTITGVYVMRDETAGGPQTFRFYTSSPTWSSDHITAEPTWTEKFSESVAASELGFRKTGLSYSMSAGDSFYCNVNGDKIWEVVVTAEVDW